MYDIINKISYKIDRNFSTLTIKTQNSVLQTMVVKTDISVI